ncbi:hypothetical protein N7520_003312 [Penicillium odoratum]|uniref:uncharacterized protein n=1 Tax=Penicillium odoratum TaxID=1167516 RepID=UPI002549A870|nr:uncharacterized protein N7520_003312 [Penicillium odoratum]KAJ5768753.1 hypothetical protein N7520_003312 [Penicillium odoratum]
MVWPLYRDTQALGTLIYGSSQNRTNQWIVDIFLKLCFQNFLELLEDIPEEMRLTVQDDLGRFRVWVGNFGGHRNPMDRLSLDHRLREAPELRCEVQNHITDISEGILAAGPLSLNWGSRTKLPTSKPSSGPEYDAGSDSDDSESDLEFWEQVKEDNQNYS